MTDDQRARFEQAKARQAAARRESERLAEVSFQAFWDDLIKRTAAARDPE